MNEELTYDELQEIHSDFVKCGDLANRMAQFYPEHQGVWVGTVSERLNILFNLLLKDIAAIRE